MSATQLTAPKVRLRFGIRLGWPITNAATFVFYVPADSFAEGSELFGKFRAYVMRFAPEIAKRLIFERS